MTLLTSFSVRSDWIAFTIFPTGWKGGLSSEGINHAANCKANVIVSVDCGITAVEEAKL
jgi:single-stranded-DNA-specific exonuclease